MKPIFSTKRGFTLLEVLIALIVVAVALSTLIKATGDIAGNTHYMRNKALAHWVAMNQLAELQIEPKWLDIGTDKDEVEAAGMKWRWLQKVEDTPDKFIRRIEIKVAREEDRLDSEKDSALATLTAYIVNPEVISLTPFVVDNGELLPPPPIPPSSEFDDSIPHDQDEREHRDENRDESHNNEPTRH